MKFAVALALCAVTVSAPLAARPAAAAPAVDHKAVDALVLIITPDQAMQSMSSRAFDTELAKTEQNDASMTSLFTQHPGMRDFVAQRMRTRLASVIQAALPDLRAELGTLLANELTDAEVGDALTFFRSATGTRLRDVMFAKVGTTADEEAAKQAALQEFMATLKPEDMAPLMAFGQSSVAAKMKTLGPRIQQTSEAWGERFAKANESAFVREAALAMADYLKQEKAPATAAKTS